jgi:CheY-like chemotaxis protein
MTSLQTPVRASLALHASGAGTAGQLFGETTKTASARPEDAPLRRVAAAEGAAALAACSLGRSRMSSPVAPMVVDSPRGRGHVLAIDDDPRVGKVLARMLTQEHEALVLTSAQEALDHLTLGERFDLILCDIVMPQMTGMDFYNRIGSIAPELAERVVFITGGGHMPCIEAFLSQPTIRWMDKPFPPLEEFRRVVQEHLLRLAGGQLPCFHEANSLQPKTSRSSP